MGERKGCLLPDGSRQYFCSRIRVCGSDERLDHAVTVMVSPLDEAGGLAPSRSIPSSQSGVLQGILGVRVRVNLIPLVRSPQICHF